MISRKPLLPYRLLVGLLGGLGCTGLYLLRSNLSVAIIAMVDREAVLEDKDLNRTAHDLCYDFNITNVNDDSHYHGKYKWSESIQGIILGSYFYGYSCTQLLGASADRFGAKWIAGLGAFVPAICNALIPVFADIHYGLVILMRILMGAFHGLLYASLFSLFARWFPDSEKNLACSCTTIFGNLGGIITMPLAGYLVKTDFLEGWPSVFYLTSLVHVLWFAAWCIFITDNPQDNKNVSEEELKYIVANNSNISKANNKKRLAIPWKAIVTSRVVWASTAAKFTGNFGYFLLCSNMPQYLDTVFGMAIHTNSWFVSLMYLITCIALSSGAPLSQWVRKKGWFSQTRNRKNFQSFAMFGCAICLLLVPIVGCNRQAVVALLLVAMFIYGFITGGEYGVIAEYAPAFAGTVFGVANTLAATTGFIGPMLIGYLLDHGDGSVRQQWNIIWYLSVGIYAFGGIVYELFGSAEPQPWGVIQDENDIEKQHDFDKIANVNEKIK